MTAHPVRTLGWTAYWGAVCLLLGGGLTKGHNWGDDFATYILQARSIVQGNPSQFVEANRFTIESSTYVLGPIAAPWGVPVLLALPYALFGVNMVALKSVNAVCYVLFLLALWWGFRRHHSVSWLFVLISLFALNPSFQSTFMNRVLSDIPFLFFSTLSIILIGRVVIDRSWLISPVADHVLLGLSLAAACFVRANGLLLVVALAVTQSIKAVQTSALPRLSSLFVARRQLAVHALPYVVFAVAVVVWRTLLPEEGYVPPSTPMSIRRVWENLYYYIDIPADFFAGVPLPRVVYGATIPLAVIGVCHRFASTYHMIVYGLLTGLLYVLWPETNGLRYVFPLLPLYLSFVVAALETSHVDAHAWSRLLWKAIRVGPAVVVLLYFAGISGAAAARNVTGRNEEGPGPYQPTSQQLFSFISTNTDPHSVIVFFKPRALRLFTDRASVMIARVDHLTIGDYVCLLQQDHRNQVPRDAISRLRETGGLVPVYRNADFECYRIQKE